MRSDVLGLLLNLDPTQKNNKTISLFMNGTRAHPRPVPLPDAWFDEVEVEGGEDSTDEEQKKNSNKVSSSDSNNDDSVNNDDAMEGVVKEKKKKIWLQKGRWGC